MSNYLKHLKYYGESFLTHYGIPFFKYLKNSTLLIILWIMKVYQNEPIPKIVTDISDNFTKEKINNELKGKEIRCDNVFKGSVIYRFDKDPKNMSYYIKEFLENEGKFITDVIEFLENEGKFITDVIEILVNKQQGELVEKLKTLLTDLTTQKDLMIMAHHGVVLENGKVLHFNQEGLLVEDIEVFAQNSKTVFQRGIETVKFNFDQAKFDEVQNKYKYCPTCLTCEYLPYVTHSYPTRYTTIFKNILKKHLQFEFYKQNVESYVPVITLTRDLQNETKKNFEKDIKDVLGLKTNSLENL